VVAIFGAAAFAASLAPPAARAQIAPTVTDGGVENRFPEGMTFRVSASSDSEIQQLRLRYNVLPDGTAAIGDADFQPGLSVSGVFELAGNNPPRIYLPPGTVIQYHWEATDADGDVGKSPPASFVYRDIRFDWKEVSADGVTVNYYSGSEAQARSMLDVATETIASMSDLLGTAVEFPVKVWIYDSVQDMKPALAKRSETFEQSIITAGVRVSSDTVLVLGNVQYDTLRHELTHVVTAVAGESAFGFLPAWLDEGTAVYGQKDPGGYKTALDRAVARGNVLSVRAITSYPGDPAKVELFYGESWSLVSFLNQQYGPERFAQLFAEIKKGKRIDAALESVYGFDQDGLEDEWRALMGLPARVTPAPATPVPSATSGQTLGPSPAAGEGGGGGGTSAATVAVLAAGVIALAGLVAAVGLVIARRYR
jgi:hypothetical protein